MSCISTCHSWVRGTLMWFSLVPLRRVGVVVLCGTSSHNFIYHCSCLLCVSFELPSGEGEEFYINGLVVHEDCLFVW